MDQVFSNSRSISLSPFNLRMKSKLHQLHQKKLQQISQKCKTKSLVKLQAKQLLQQTKKLTKNRQKSRKFKVIQQNWRRNNFDKHMLQAIHNNKYSKSNIIAKQYLIKLNHPNSHRRTTQQNRIKQDNKKLCYALAQLEMKNDYKLKMKTQIKEYQKLKEHMAVFKTHKLISQRQYKNTDGFKTEKMSCRMKHNTLPSHQSQGTQNVIKSQRKSHLE